MTGALTEAAKACSSEEHDCQIACGQSAKTLKKEKSVYSKHLKRKVPDVEQWAGYHWDGVGLELYNRTGPEWTLYIQGEDGAALYDQLEKADTNWEVNTIIEPYSHIIEYEYEKK